MSRKLESDFVKITYQRGHSTDLKLTNQVTHFKKVNAQFRQNFFDAWHC